MIIAYVNLYVMSAVKKPIFNATAYLSR